MTKNLLGALTAPALAIGLGVAATPALGQAVDLNLNGESLRLNYSAPMPSFSARYELGGLISDQGAVNVVQTHAGLLVTGDAGAAEANVTAGLGGRLVLLDADTISGGGLAVGGVVEARLPAYNRLGMSSYLYWAPGASAFGDLAEHMEYALSVDYDVIRNASIYLGYRQIRVKLDRGPRLTAESGFHFGMRLRF